MEVNLFLIIAKVIILLVGLLLIVLFIIITYLSKQVEKESKKDVGDITRKDFLRLPIEERRKILSEQANNPEVIEYYKGVDK